MPARPGVPYAGVASFARAPLLALPAAAGALAEMSPEIVVFGIPFDGAVGYRPGQRLAPRAIRDMSTRFSMAWGRDNPGLWDFEADRWYLQGALLVDAGDVDPSYFDLETLDAGVGAMVQAIAPAAVPIALGGDHSVTFPAVQGLAPLFAPGAPLAGQKLHIVQLDAHLDYSDTMVNGFRRSNSSGIRRAAELGFVEQVTCIGLRGLRVDPAALQASRAHGHRVITMPQVRSAGLARVVDMLPENRLVYLTLDIDALDPAVAPGTSSPEPDGFTFAEVRALLRATAARNRVIAADVVEVNPYLDSGGLTSLLAARAVVEMAAFIHAGKGG